MAKPKQSFKPGDAFFVPVKQENIEASHPCKKDACMVSLALLPWLIANYGNRNFKAKSTNHGAIFVLNGRQYLTVFDTATIERIGLYDLTFQRTKSEERAKATVRPFKARIMVEASHALVKWPAMSEETKKKLRAIPRKDPNQHQPKRISLRRLISI